MKVLLVSMPFGALERQALGSSILKARLTQRGIACDLRYLTFPFAELIGQGEYMWMNYEAPYTAFAGDWSFTEALYGPRPEVDRGYISEVLQETWRMTPGDIQRILRIRTLAPHFLEHCLAAAPWHEYDLIGFTSTFEQNIASLAFAKMLKARHPQVRIVFGGANWEAEMGHELHRQFPFVDYVCSSESEMSLPRLVERVSSGAQVGDIPGIVYRNRRGESVYTGSPELIPVMDDLPVPDFSDYFHGLNNSTVGASVMPTMLFESSRGCWWGAKSHCTFCGLNGGSMAFRAKTPARALDELKYLADRWRVDLVEAVDNILDMNYFHEFLPRLAEANLGIQMFYEVKANLSRRHLRLLKTAGVIRMQPGIESMSDHVLKLMRKGTTALKNIQLLKWCIEYGITADWNLLYGFPGETREDYRQTLDLLRAIRHLNAPTACGPLRLDRFSPYHHAPEKFGITNVRAMAPYRYLYPFEEHSLQRLAYYFDYDYEPHADPSGYADEVVRYAAEWKANAERGTLTAVLRPDGALALVDTRSDAPRPALILSGLEQAAYLYCDEVHSAASVTRHLRNLFPEIAFGEIEVLGFLDSAVENRIMVKDGANYLALAIATKPLRRQLERVHDEQMMPVRSPVHPESPLIVLQS